MHAGSTCGFQRNARPLQISRRGELSSECLAAWTRGCINPHGKCAVRPVIHRLATIASKECGDPLRAFDGRGGNGLFVHLIKATQESMPVEL